MVGGQCKRKISERSAVKNWLKNLIRSSESSARASADEALREQYERFRHFLKTRQKALSVLDSPSPLDRRAISEQIAGVIRSLNILSGERYPDLLPILREIEGGNPETGRPIPEDSSPPPPQSPWPLKVKACRTFQDLMTRAHDLAIEEMFTLLDKYDIPKRGTKKIQTGLPINLHVIDLGGGLASGSEAKLLSKEQILSVPLQAMFKGIYYPGVTWSGPIGINLKGLMVIMAQSTSRPEENFWDKTYALVAGEYLNYNSRLGYHYSSVDAYCGDESRNNHIRFSFQGGAADDLRRARRARFIGSVLERLGFATEVQKDAVNASFRRRPRSEVEEKLDLLGRLMGCSRQRDMVMNDEAVVNWHIEAFLKGNYSFTPGD
jgi:hypothetical protein